MIAVRYIGKRDEYIDGAYGSGVRFVKGEAQLLPDDLALKLLRHRDVYERVEDAEKVADVEPPKMDSDLETQALRDELGLMEKDALCEFITNHFGEKPSRKAAVEAIRARAIELVDLYGVK
jgi:hypothetical protein